MIKTSVKLGFTALSFIILAGCAQNVAQSGPDGSRPGSARASSYSDTLDHVRGRGSIHAPAQIQLGMGERSDEQSGGSSHDRELIESRQVRELLEPRSFLGTIPCPSSDSNCQPVRISLTFAPAGQWRLRAQSAAPNTSGKEYFAQGCWYRIGAEPTRIALVSASNTIVADLSFQHDRRLQVNSFNQYQPLLETSLTRQRDLDPIEELDDQELPVCQEVERSELEEMPAELILPELQ